MAQNPLQDALRALRQALAFRSPFGYNLEHRSWRPAFYMAPVPANMDRFLERFDPNPDAAAEKYLRLREKLVTYFG